LKLLIRCLLTSKSPTVPPSATGKKVSGLLLRLTFKIELSVNLPSPVKSYFRTGVSWQKAVGPF
jgi:hypothetical protein